jgi:hypothetical protein
LSAAIAASIVLASEATFFFPGFGAGAVGASDAASFFVPFLALVALVLCDAARIAASVASASASIEPGSGAVGGRCVRVWCARAARRCGRRTSCPS